MGKGLHIAIILDGNRRYAQKHKLEPWKGHEFGVKKVWNLIEWIKELDVRELTLYTFSMDNFNRPKKEIDILFDLFKKNIDKLNKDERIKRYGIKINFVGRLEMFSEEIRGKMKKVMQDTSRNENYIINFAMAYGGRIEIIDAIKKIASLVHENKIRIDEINEQTVSKNLYLKDEPDLIIRPGGEKRVSDFLIWQGNYSEWYLTDKLWPEFTKKDIIDAINDYKKRKRRFGR
jgi:tritrans,polycis-undecaprenyl-diphosphate synthase [geranylgeranyl-diphosphate specific]